MNFMLSEPGFEEIKGLTGLGSVYSGLYVIPQIQVQNCFLLNA